MSAYVGNVGLLEVAGSLSLVPPLPDKSAVEGYVVRLSAGTDAELHITISAVARSQQVEMSPLSVGQKNGVALAGKAVGCVIFT